MLYKKVPLDPVHDNVYLEVYAADRVGTYTSKALLVIPGGGYSVVCADREGEPIALAFLSHGFNCFVLHYSVGGQKYFPGQLIEASLAVQHIKDHAQEYNIDPEKVFAVGFSAGGHLAASLGALWHLPEIYEATGMPYGYNRPAGTMLIYPVISGVAEFSHVGSFRNLTGVDEPSDEVMRLCSIEQNVDERTAPTYILHTSNDQVVDVRHSLLLASAFKAAGKEFEMHIYPDAPHGVALGNRITRCWEAKFDNPAIAKWVENAAVWTDSL